MRAVNVHSPTRPLRAAMCDRCGRVVVWFDARETGAWTCSGMTWAELGIDQPRYTRGADVEHQPTADQDASA